MKIDARAIICEQKRGISAGDVVRYIGPTDMLVTAISQGTVCDGYTYSNQRILRHGVRHVVAELWGKQRPQRLVRLSHTTTWLTEAWFVRV